MAEVVGVIPARYDSSRLPGKVLLDIAGKPMLQRVWEAARKSRLLNSLLIASDSRQVLDFCSATGIPCLKTGSHPSGTDRLFEVVERTGGAFYVNIQGDEPTLRADQIDALVEPLLAGRAEVTTLRVAITEEEAANPNSVKVVTGPDNQALYFSRSRIPYYRETPEQERQYFKHIGIYGYSRAALTRFHSLPQSPLELAERLEQLRFLENGIGILAIPTLHNTIGVDTAADLEAARAHFGEGR